MSVVLADFNLYVHLIQFSTAVDASATVTFWLSDVSSRPQFTRVANLSRKIVSFVAIVDNTGWQWRHLPVAFYGRVVDAVLWGNLIFRPLSSRNLVTTLVDA